MKHIPTLALRTCLSDFETAVKFHQQSLSIAKDIGDKGLAGKADTNLGNAYYSLGDFKKGIEFHKQS